MRVRSYNARADIVRDGDQSHECCLVLTGFVHRSKLLKDGRRQILSFHTPGDMPDLQGLHLPVMDHSVCTLMRTTAAFIEHAAVRQITREHPGIAEAFWRDTLVDAAIFREWMTGLGQRDARERVTHLLCEISLRLRGVGLATEAGFSFPATQTDIGDALGLSTVHVNRVLQGLRGDGLVRGNLTALTILDWQGLQAAGDFDPTYLQQRPKEAKGGETSGHASLGSAQAVH
ncbi:Crp/Fnr family transcriptional regulator [Pararoseomonas baculiformis]|uniref:Crp/Fnr family transcriptional regulator n=1 Tax=Pararoseomonas baculiformis TaxID=2820812 RepID=UPI001AE02C8B|nr:Crp/Fnr family transcriptional regulator [Pararoseomonas baculiformis]